MSEGGSEELVDWDDIAAWWRNEAAGDPAYREDIEPMLERLMPEAPSTVIELGCGEGQWLRWLGHRGARAMGCDRSMRLLSDAIADGPVVCARLPDLGWLRTGAVGTALSVFVLDLVADLSGFFTEAARVVRPGGSLVIVINHPGFTAPGSGPIADVDGEVLWRWGAYLEDGASEQPAGPGRVMFFHRPIAHLLTAAAEAGWSLAAVEESALGPAAIAREPGYAGQEGIPRFFGAHWKRRLTQAAPKAAEP